MARRADVLRPVQQPRLGALAVAAGAAELLVVGVERHRRVGVEHPAHVRLVDPHPERDRGRDDPRRAVEELRHRPVPRAGAEPGVVERHPLAGGGERVARRLRAGVGRGVDDPRAAELAAARAISRCLSSGERACWTDSSMCGRSKSPITTSGSRSPSRRQISTRTGGAAVAVSAIRTARRARRPARRAAGSRAGSPPPLADEVRLVDDEQPRAGAPQRRAGLVVGELLGRDEDELVGPARLDQRRRPRARRLRASSGPWPAGPPPADARAGRPAARSAARRRPSGPRAADRPARRSPTCRRRWAAPRARPGRRGGRDRLLLARPQPLEPEPLPRELADRHEGLPAPSPSARHPECGSTSSALLRLLYVPQPGERRC